MTFCIKSEDSISILMMTNIQKAFSFYLFDIPRYTLYLHSNNTTSKSTTPQKKESPEKPFSWSPGIDLYAGRKCSATEESLFFIKNGALQKKFGRGTAQEFLEVGGGVQGWNRNVFSATAEPLV